MKLNEVNNFMMRVMSSIFIVLIGIGVLHSVWVKNIFIISLFLLSMYELLQLKPLRKNVMIYGFMISMSCAIAIQLGREVVFSCLALAWAHDIGGYFFGKFFKGPKIAPSISPNKTWSGFFGGCFLTCVALIGAPLPLEKIVLIAYIINVICLLGDLWESKIKRGYKMKDSGSFIPGHGGVLDRFDAFLMLIFIMGMSFFIAKFAF